MFFIIIIISALHVSGCFSAHHQELIKLYVPWVLLRFPAVYRWCGWVGTPTHPHQLLMMAGKTARNM
jgi:hypothetical protein